jgi:chromatin remodeling complex protein RSC6
MRTLMPEQRSTFVSPLFGVLEVSPHLSSIIGVGHSSRLEATERLHAYVAQHGLSKGDGTVRLDGRMKALFMTHPESMRFEKREWVTDAELFEAVARNLG